MANSNSRTVSKSFVGSPVVAAIHTSLGSGEDRLATNGIPGGKSSAVYAKTSAASFSKSSIPACVGTEPHHRRQELRTEEQGSKTTTVYPLVALRIDRMVQNHRSGRFERLNALRGEAGVVDNVSIVTSPQTEESP